MTTTGDCLAHMAAGLPIDPATDMGQTMMSLSARGRAIVARMNREALNDDARQFFSELVGSPVPASFRVFLPFTSDFGLHITVGEDVFINSGCRFQDQGGIDIGDGVLIGHNVIITTLNHDLDPAKRAIMHPQRVVIGPTAWIGSGAIILPGVHIGEGAVVGAGSVVTKDVEPFSVVVGNPARTVRSIEPEQLD